MNLLEVDGKALVRTHGVRVPQGALWPSLPDCAGPLVIKAQVPEGKRGKRGGIVFVDAPAAVPAAVDTLLGRSVGPHRIDSVYIEERLAIARELYLAVSVDRDRQCHVIIASPHGGMDIEAVAESDILRLPIDPLLGWHRFHGEYVARFLKASEGTHEALCAVAEALYRLAEAEDAELVELNPLAVTAGDEVVACDAKVVLDSSARFRHTEWEGLATPPARSALEAAIAASGAVGIEIDPEGDVIAVISGAGLMMATLDLFSDAGLTVRCVIDLGGTVLSGGEGLRRVLEAIAPTHPKATFINAFMQTALCDVFAGSLAEAHAATALPGRMVVRLKGRRAEVGRELLQSLGFEVHEELRPAISAITTTGRA